MKLWNEFGIGYLLKNKIYKFRFIFDTIVEEKREEGE